MTKLLVPLGMVSFVIAGKEYEADENSIVTVEDPSHIEEFYRFGAVDVLGSKISESAALSTLSAADQIRLAAVSETAQTVDAVNAENLALKAELAALKAQLEPAAPEAGSPTGDVSPVDATSTPGAGAPASGEAPVATETPAPAADVPAVDEKAKGKK